MKDKIHPKYVECTVTCGCGEKFVTCSTRPKINVEICSKCHPFYTGKQKFVDTAGRVEKFQKKFAWDDAKAEKAMEHKRAKKPKPLEPEPSIARVKKEKEKDKKKEEKAAKKAEKEQAKKEQKPNAARDSAAQKPQEAQAKKDESKPDGPAPVSDTF